MASSRLFMEVLLTLNSIRISTRSSDKDFHETTQRRLRGDLLKDVGNLQDLIKIFMPWTSCQDHYENNNKTDRHRRHCRGPYKIFTQEPSSMAPNMKRSQDREDPLAGTSEYRIEHEHKKVTRRLWCATTRAWREGVWAISKFTPITTRTAWAQSNERLARR